MTKFNNTEVFKGNINFWLDNQPNVYINTDVEFTIPKIEDCLIEYDCDIAELQEKINDSTFLQETLMEKFQINIMKLDYKYWENYNYE